MSDFDRIQAELAAKEKEALEVIKEDICKWLSKVVSELEDISPLTFMERLDTGVALCRLVTLIQQSTTAVLESGKKLNFTVPMDALSCSVKAEPGSFFARDNTANFISWCRELGVEEAVIFESEGLVLHKDEKRVILCLLDVARYAERVGILPPELVRMEREIEQLEASEGERSPIPWEIEMEEEKKQETEPRTITGISLTSPPTAGLQGKDVHVSPTASKTSDLELTASPIANQGKEEGVTNVTTPEQKKSQNDTLKHSSSSRKVLHTPSRIPVPIGGNIRTRHKIQNVQLSTVKKPQKRQREEQDREEDEGNGEVQKAKKLKRSPLSTVTSPVLESIPQDKVAAVNERHESVDEKVMRRMGECTCNNKIKVKNCGRGKFIVRGVSGRNIIIYARMLSDRVMVRVGGGWDTLDHFLLKHDPCRIHHITLASSPGLKTARKSLAK